jgi:hypothetical protein
LLYAFLTSALDESKWSVLSPGKRPCYPLDLMLGKPKSQSGRDGEENNTHHCPYRELNRARSIRSLVSILTELHHNDLMISVIEVD